MFKRTSLVLFLTLLSSVAVAQGNAQYQKLAEALNKAQQAAIRKGDEKLDCATLEKQLITQANDPAVHDNFTKAAADAQNVAAAGKPDGAKMTGQAALAAFSSLAPGGGWASMMAAASQIPIGAAQTAQNIQQRMQQTDELIKILPQIVRAQRLIELAQTKRCEWLPTELVEGDPLSPSDK